MGGRNTAHDRRQLAVALAVLGALTLFAADRRADAAEEPGRIERIELKADASSTKVIVMLSRPLAFDVHVLEGDAAKKSARRLVLDFANTTLGPEATKPIDVSNDLLRQIRPGQFNAKTARIVLDLASDAPHSVDAFESPPHVTIALGNGTGAAMPATGAAEAPNPTVPAAASGSPAPTTPSGTAETSKAAARTIPIRAHGRRPYSLNYAR